MIPPPEIPKGASPHTAANTLYRAPRVKKYDKPWYFYDHVDPTPKFRRAKGPPKISTSAEGMIQESSQTRLPAAIGPSR